MEVLSSDFFESPLAMLAEVALNFDKYDAEQPDAEEVVLFNVHAQTNTKGRKQSRNKRQKLNVPVVQPHTVLPDLPEEYKNRIKNMNGAKEVLVIQKALTSTDLGKGNNRLSIPFRQINNPNFLTEEERKYLDQQEKMEVAFMEPSYEMSKMVLRQWDMPKSTGKVSSMYVLRTHWIAIAKDKYNLKIGDVVQIWSFRIGKEEKLCLALVVVSRKGDNGGNVIRSCESVNIEDENTRQIGEAGVDERRC